MQDTSYQSILPDRVDLSLYDPAQSMIPDGFAANATIRYLPRRYYAQTVKQIEWLRDATDAMWPRQFPVPEDLNTVIEPYGTYSTQLRMVTGAYIWGWDIAILTSQTTADVFINVTDPCSQRSLFSTYINSAIATSSSKAKRPRVIPRPYRIDGNGLIDAQIKNNSSSNLQMTFVLFASEPSASLNGTVVPPTDLEYL